jgi:Mrp family chromosome partitioning ATPase
MLARGRQNSSVSRATPRRAPNMHVPSARYAVSTRSPRCCSLSTLSRRQQADLEDRIVSVVGKRTDPVLGTDLATLGWVHPRTAVSDDGTLQVLLRLPTLLHPKLDELKEQVKAQTEDCLAEWATEHQLADRVPSAVNVEAMASTPVSMTARLLEDPADFLETQGPGLSEISHFLAVYSCKGGVGKSTVAVNLALELARMGGRVGLLDLDLYGPSLPVLWQPKDPAVRRSEKGKGMILPIEEAGVKFLSLGFVNRNSGVPGSGTENGAAIMRGPMAGKVAEQLMKGTDWGPLDVLVLDMPPGTGDVQLQVCQDLSLSGAVAVTTPSKLALADTRKGIEMFTSLGVPTLAVVQNMSYFEVSLHYLYMSFASRNRD